MSPSTSPSPAAKRRTSSQLVLTFAATGRNATTDPAGLEPEQAAADEPWIRELENRVRRSYRRITDCCAEHVEAMAPGAMLVKEDALTWLAKLPEDCIQAIVTDPPYGLIEYDAENHDKLRRGRGGVWRMPPTLDGCTRSPLPRFTVLNGKETERLEGFSAELGRAALRVLVPGGHLIVASNPVLSTLTFYALVKAGLEKRGEVIRLVQTLRGGDRPKGAHEEFTDVTVMPRSCWEPWGLFRKPFDGTVADNLRQWGAGGLRRRSPRVPFKDVIECPPARGAEREIAPHPSLKPQKLMRQLVRASLPLGIGIVVDPFCGSSATVAAAAHLGYPAIGVERDPDYYQMALASFQRLRDLEA